MESKHIGLYFGSFNPIHTAHLLIAGHVLAFEQTDEVWFVISPQSPFKKDETIADFTHRLNMVQIAIQDEPNMKACDIEFSLPVPSYTIDTLTALSERYPNNNFSIIIGEDNLIHFHKWKRYDEILEKHRLIVFPREHKNTVPQIQHPNISLISAPLIDISSSLIRQLIRTEKKVSVFLPEGVESYIKKNKLYL